MAWRRGRITVVRHTEPILIKDGATNLLAQASLVHGVTSAEMTATDAQWLPFLTQAVADALARGVSPSDLPDNKHWRWERKA